MSCPYGTEDWYCCRAAGHDGPHESVPIGSTDSAPRRGSKPVKQVCLVLSDDAARLVWAACVSHVETKFTAGTGDPDAATLEVVIAEIASQRS